MDVREDFGAMENVDGALSSSAAVDALEGDCEDALGCESAQSEPVGFVASELSSDDVGADARLSPSLSVEDALDSPARDGGRFNVDALSKMADGISNAAKAMEVADIVRLSKAADAAVLLSMPHLAKGRAAGLAATRASSAAAERVAKVAADSVMRVAVEHVAAAAESIEADSVDLRPVGECAGSLASFECPREVDGARSDDAHVAEPDCIGCDASFGRADFTNGRIARSSDCEGESDGAGISEVNGS